MIKNSNNRLYSNALNKNKLIKTLNFKFCSKIFKHYFN